MLDREESRKIDCRIKWYLDRDADYEAVYEEFAHVLTRGAFQMRVSRLRRFGLKEQNLKPPPKCKRCDSLAVRSGWCEQHFWRKRH